MDDLGSLTEPAPATGHTLVARRRRLLLVQLGLAGVAVLDSAVGIVLDHQGSRSVWIAGSILAVDAVLSIVVGSRHDAGHQGRRGGGESVGAERGGRR